MDKLTKNKSEFISEYPQNERALSFHFCLSLSVIKDISGSDKV